MTMSAVYILAAVLSSGRLGSAVLWCASRLLANTAMLSTVGGAWAHMPHMTLMKQAAIGRHEHMSACADPWHMAHDSCWGPVFRFGDTIRLAVYHS